MPKEAKYKKHLAILKSTNQGEKQNIVERRR